jgi:serine protease inhibitor
MIAEVKVFLPRFSITWGSLDMRDLLADMGMTLPFDRLRADFSGINGHRPPHDEALHISAIYHKTFAADRRHR